MSARDCLPDLIRLLYAAPGSTEGWHAFLLELCTALDGRRASFISHNLAIHQGGVTVTAPTDRTAVRTSLDDWAHSDPSTNSSGLHHLASRRGVVREQLISHTALTRTPYYNDFVRYEDITRCIAGMIDVEPHVLALVSLNAGEVRGSFEGDDAALLRVLMPHLQRALEIHRRLATAEAIAVDSLALLDRLVDGVIVLNRVGRVVFANRSARDILRARDGLMQEKRELRAASALDTASLQKIILTAVQTSLEHNPDAGGLMAVGRLNGRRPLRIAVAPGTHNRPLLGPEAVGAIVFVTDPERTRVLTEDEIQSLFGLTPAEAKLTHLVVNGFKMCDAAVHLDLRIGTVRTRIKAIFEKTNTHRQADLVRLVLNATPSV